MMLVTLLGISIEVKPVQPWKAQPPMYVTLLGISIEVNPVHWSKALPPMLVTLLGITVFLHPAISLLVDVSMIALQFSRESYVALLSST